MRAIRLSAHAVPPFLTGAALAVTGEVALGLLLYGGAGFIPALSVIVAVLFASVGLGIRVGAGDGLPGGGRSGRGGGDPDPEAAWPPLEESAVRVDAVRRRWLFLLVAVSAAAIFAGLWEVFGGFGAGAAAQGAGLALLGALPMYAGGVVLGVQAGTSGGALRGGSGPPAFLGAAAGVAVAGHLFFPVLSPTAVLLFCLMSLSAAALVHGRALEREVSVAGVRIRSKGGRRVRVERWVRARPPMVRTALLEGGRIRVLIGEAGEPVRAVEQVVEAGLTRWSSGIRRALVLGGGGAGVASRLAARGEAEVRLVDPDPALLVAIEEDLPLAGGDLRTEVRPVADLLVGEWAPFPEQPVDLILLEWQDRLIGGRLDRFPPRALERLRLALADDGILVLFPLAFDPERGEDGLLPLGRDVAARFARTSLYVARRSDEDDLPPGFSEAGTPAPEERAERVAILVAGTEGGAPWPERIGEFLKVPVAEADDASPPGPHG